MTNANTSRSNTAPTERKTMTQHAVDTITEEFHAYLSGLVRHSMTAAEHGAPAATFTAEEICQAMARLPKQAHGEAFRVLKSVRTDAPAVEAQVLLTAAVLWHTVRETTGGIGTYNRDGEWIPSRVTTDRLISNLATLRGIMIKHEGTPKHRVLTAVADAMASVYPSRIWDTMANDVLLEARSNYEAGCGGHISDAAENSWLDAMDEAGTAIADALTDCGIYAATFEDHPGIYLADGTSVDLYGPNGEPLTFERMLAAFDKALTEDVLALGDKAAPTTRHFPIWDSNADIDARRGDTSYPVHPGTKVPDLARFTELGHFKDCLAALRDARGMGDEDTPEIFTAEGICRALAALPKDLQTAAAIALELATDGFGVRREVKAVYLEASKLWAATRRAAATPAGGEYYDEDGCLVPAEAAIFAEIVANFNTDGGQA